MSAEALAEKPTMSTPQNDTNNAAFTAKALAGRKVRVALVGAGYIADTHMAALAATEGVEVVAVCDVDATKAQRFATKHKIAQSAGSIRELVERVKPDAAHVLVPPPLHESVTSEILSAGVHVLLEKPMVLTAAAGKRLVEHAAKSGARLGVNHNYVFHPLFVRLQKDLAAGRIGKIEHAVVFSNNPLRQLAAGDFGHWMFAAPQNIILEQGPHPISQLTALFGKVVSASASPSGRHDLPGGRVFFDTWQASFQCERGTAQLFIAFGREFPESYIHVVGQDGSIRIDLSHGGYTVHEKTRWPDFYESYLTGRRDAKSWNAAARDSFLSYVLPLLKIQPRRDPFFVGMKGSIGAFYKSLREGTRLPISGEDGVAVLEACEQLTAPVAAELLKSPAPPAPAILEFTENRAGEVAVLGATGFIGGHVVEKLLQAGKPVRILARKAHVLPRVLCDPRVRIVKGSIDDQAAVEKLISGTDCVIHLASGGGDSYADFERTIIQGTERVANACLKFGVRRLLYTSTVAVYYFGGSAVVTEETPTDRKPEKRSHYSRAKSESERRLLQLYKDKKLPISILRPAVVVGERGRPAHTGVGQWPKDTQCAGWGAGVTPIPFVLASDVADALILAISAPNIEGTSFNLAGDVRLTAREYVAQMQQISGRPMKFYPTPLWMTQTSDLFKWFIKLLIRKPENPFPSYRDLKTRAFFAPLDCDRAKRVLGWKPVADRARFIELGIRDAMEVKV